MVGLKDVYKIDGMTGNFLGFENISSEMAPAIPKCPHCQQPIRQYVTQRYNRLINRAVIDEMSKRFVVTGQTELRDLEAKLSREEDKLERTRADVMSTLIPNVHMAENAQERLVKTIAEKTKTRYKTSEQIRSAIVQAQRRAADRHQPAHKLYEATLHALHDGTSLENPFAAMSLEERPAPGARDLRITLGARILLIRIDTIMSEDKFRIISSARSRYGASAAASMFPTRRSPESCTGPFLKSCSDFIATCTENELPKLAVEGILYYARIARLFETSCFVDSKNRKNATEYRDKAQSLLEEGIELCKRKFRDADSLLQAINQSIKLLEKERYEEITPEELAAIKSAMVSGSRGIATHSGHWYNCVNGHPVSRASKLIFGLY